MASTIAAGTTSGTAIAIAGDTSGVLQLQTNGTTAAVTIDTSQNVGIGTSSPATKLDVSNGAITAGAAGVVLNGRNSSTNPTSGAGYFSLNTNNVNATNGGISIQTLSSGVLTERMRIDTSGFVMVGTTNTNPAEGNVKGVSLPQDGRVSISAMGSEVVRINRGTDDGVLVFFHQAGTAEGNISVSGTTVSYNGGHLSRYAQTTTPKDDTLLKGTVLSNLDEMNVYIDAENNSATNEQLNKVKVSDVEGDVNVAGVFVNWEHDKHHNVDEINMAMTGDMIIRIAEGVVVQKGDLLMSAGDGTAKPQGDDIRKSKTVAKVTSNHVTCTYADGSYCVPCVLMAC